MNRIPSLVYYVFLLSVIGVLSACDAGVAPPVNLKATHILALEFIDLANLQRHAAVTES